MEDSLLALKPGTEYEAFPIARQFAAQFPGSIPLDDARQLGDIMWAVYTGQRQPDASILNEAIYATQAAVDCELSSGVVDPALHFALGDRLHARFELKNELDDLNRAISSFQCVIEHTLDGDPRQALRLNRLATSLVDRFHCRGAREDIDRATASFRSVAALLQDDVPEKPRALSNYASCLMERFGRFNQAEDLESASSAQIRAVALVPDQQECKPWLLSNLGNSYLIRYNRSGELDDLNMALSLHRRAVELTPNDHPRLPVQLTNIGASFLARFRRTDSLKDLEEAVSAHRHALVLTPNDHADRPLRFHNFGDAALVRFHRTGNIDDLEQAISAHRHAVEHTLDVDPHKAGRLDSLGGSLVLLFERMGVLGDLDESITIYRRALDLTPDDHPSKPKRLYNLGQSLRTYFERTGELDALEQSISAHHHALESAHYGSTERLSMLDSLGFSLLRRFERLGELEDIEGSVSLNRHALEITPDDHPSKVTRYAGVGVSLFMRFERTAKLGDLDDAISAFHRALELISDGHPYESLLQANLCRSLRQRFDCTDKIEALVSAISAGNRAIHLTPEGHTTHASRYNSLAGCYQRLYEHSSELKDLDVSIYMFRMAISLTPEGHPYLASWFQNLGEVLKLRFTRCRNQTDFDAAFRAFMDSTLQTIGDPVTRFESARRCARMLSSNPTLSSEENILSAHARVIETLPEIAWLGHGIHRRFYETSRLARHINDAVAAAVAAGALESAVEWLEAGRTLVWSQLLSLRTSLDELRKQHPDLANTLRDLRKQLQLSAHAAFDHDFATLRDVPSVTINREADGYRRLVIAYDALLKDIRCRTGFEDFLRPKRFSALLQALKPASGPIVLVNVAASRCDALCVLPTGSITLIPLLDLTLERAHALQSLWKDTLRVAPERMRTAALNKLNGSSFKHPSPTHVEGDQRQTLLRHSGRVQDDDPFLYLPEHTWEWIVRPVAQALQLLTKATPGHHPHNITWCPTGPLTQIPLHAAGIYRQPSGPRAYDLIVSSYTPSLSTLQRCFEEAKQPMPVPNMLIVTQPASPGHTRLPNATLEGSCVTDVMHAAGIPSKLFEHEQATVAAIQGVIDRHPWAHFACHGSQRRDDATQSAFTLYDGSLTLSDLMRKVSSEAELAFLSACQTATGDVSNPEESVHLAAGMLTIGFKGVVATMWSIWDEDAPVIVRAYYEELIKLRQSGVVGRGQTGAALALHVAAARLRDNVGERNFGRWAPFVHFGT